MKRVFDYSVALIALMVFALPMLIIAIAVRISMGSPVFFRQTRPGLQGAPFTLLKFRTMKELFDPQGNLLPDEKRTCKVGNFLRLTSLDELPELLNVLRGDMSLVGPRPLLMAYLDSYSPTQARRHEVLPGITGLAQINGRNNLSWSDTFRLDVWYVDHHSFWLDIKILFMTIPMVFKAEGISKDGQFSREFFRNDQEDSSDA